MANSFRSAPTPPVVALVGGVGTGKSTICRRLSATLALVPLPDYMEVLDEAIRRTFYSRPPIDRFRLLLSVEETRVRAIDTSVAGGFVLDRSGLCLLAHEFAVRSLNTSVDGVELAAADIDSLRIVVPHRTIFLNATERVRRERCRRRGSRMPDFFFRDDYNSQLAVFFQALSSCLPIRFVDTTGHTIDEVSREVVAALTAPTQPVDTGSLASTLKDILC